MACDFFTAVPCCIHGTFKKKSKPVHPQEIGCKACGDNHVLRPKMRGKKNQIFHINNLLLLSTCKIETKDILISLIFS